MLSHFDSLSIHIDGGGGNPDEMRAAYRTLNKCHNFRSLEVEISQGGCLVSNNDQHTFGFSEDAQFSNLTSFRLSQYEWIFSQTSTFRPYAHLSAELWLKVMDWTKLERLDIDHPPKLFLDLFRKKLTGLQSSIPVQSGATGEMRKQCVASIRKHRIYATRIPRSLQNSLPFESYASVGQGVT